MKREEKSKSSLHEDVITHYSSGYEEKRLDINEGKIERERTRELLQRFLPPTPATIIDIGGGTGKHALWLARKGYEVHLVDNVPLHIELAKEESAQQPELPLSSAEVGMPAPLIEMITVLMLPYCSVPCIILLIKGIV